MHSLRKFVTGYYNVLLICLILLFVIRPDETETDYRTIWKIFLTLALLSSVYNTNRTEKFRSIAIVLAVPAIVLSWVDLFIMHETIFITNAVLTLAFMILITAAVIYDVLRGKGTAEALKGVICAYFMVGLAFAYLYYLIGYLVPGAFSFSHFPGLLASEHTHYLSQMIYYSFVTLLQIGYGDITAIADSAQTASVIEGIFGQFYIAILVARLVSVYSALERKG